MKTTQDSDGAIGPDGDAPQARAPIRFELLGPLRILAGEVGIADTLGRKAQALLAFLAATPGHRASRERLAGLLWGERFDEQARQSLRQTLMTLRRNLNEVAPGLLTVDRNDVALCGGRFVTDLIAFERAETAEGLEVLRAAAALWRGGFLLDLDIPSPAYEDWVRGLRDTWRLRMVMLQLRLSRRLLEAGQTADALLTVNALVEIDPLNEEARRLELVIVARCSGAAAALQCYQRFAALLERELGVAPEPETRALAARLMQGDGPPATVAPDAVPRGAILPGVVIDAVVMEGRPWRRGLALAAVLLVTMIAGAGAMIWRDSMQPASVATASIQAPLFSFHVTDVTGDTPGTFREDFKTKLALLPTAALVSERRAAGFAIDLAVQPAPGGQHAVNLRLIEVATGQTLWADSMVAPVEADSRIAAAAAVRLYAELLSVLQQRRGPPPAVPPALLAGWNSIVGGITRERVAEGRRIFQAALDANPDDAAAQLGMAHYISLDLTNRWSRQREADTIKAMDYLQRAIREMPRNTTAYFTLGLIHKARRDYSHALTAWQVSLAIEPRSARVNSQVAHVNLLMGNVEEGVERAEMAIQLDPNAMAIDRAYFYAGMGHLLAGDYPRAEQRLAKAIAANPVLPDAYAWRVAALAQAGRQAEAEALYADMMRRFPWWNVDHHVTQAVDRKAMDRFSAGLNKVLQASH